MQNELDVEGKIYVSSKRLSKELGYTNDHLSRLCRQGKVRGKLVSRTWFIDKEHLVEVLGLDKEKRTEEKRKEKKEESGFGIAEVQTEIPRLVSRSRGEANLPYYTESRLRAKRALLPEPKRRVLVSRRKQFFLEEPARHLALFASVLFFVSVSYIGIISFDAQKIAKVYEETSLAFGTVILDAERDEGLYLARAGELTLFDQFAHRVYISLSPFFENKKEQLAVTEETKGVVIVPATSSEEENQKIKDSLENSFSDEVEVEFVDENSGVITPVFKGGKEEEYLFMLVPLEEE